ncbi:MAG: DsbA family protein [Acidobacteriaceae bacterium]|nr:DsbA family protein [Acidobacteriaceae bacterium]
MRHVFVLGLSATLLFAGLAAAYADPVAPKIDKQKLEAYLRYAEGVASDVQFQVDDPAPSAYPGFYQLSVHMTRGTQKQDKRYYVSQDGQRIVNGTFWSLNESPFSDALAHLTTDGPSFGVSDAKVTVVVFSDFQCPYCREFAKSIRTNIPQKYPKDVRVVEKNFPIDSIHPWARAAAEAGACMAEQSTGAFWAYHDWMFDHQSAVNTQFQDKKSDFTNYLKETAAALAQEQKVDAQKVRSCIDTHASAAEVAKDMAEGDKLMIGSTPTFYINGRPVPGAIPWASLDSLIQMELNRPKEIGGSVAIARNTVSK